MTAAAADLADANLVQAVRLHARCQQPVEYVEDDGVILVAGSTSYPGGFRNCAIRTDSAVAPERVLTRARDFFGARGRGFSVIVRAMRDGDLESLLQLSGLRCVGSSPCMLLQAPLAAPQLAPGVTVERMSSERHVQEFLAINQEAFPDTGLSAEEVTAYFAKPDELLREDIIGFVIYRDRLPCATAITLLSGRSAGIYWVGTAVAARRQGLAEVCVRLASNAGFEAGAEVVTLQASRFGEALYRRLGYVDYDEQRYYFQRRPK